MSSFNCITLMGHLTRDPALTYTPNSTAVCDFGIATNRTWTDQTSQKREEVCFVDCRAFGRTAENIHKFFKKGRPILLQGRLSFDQWTGQDGAKRSKHRVTVEMFTFLPAGGQPVGGPPPGENYEDAAGDPREQPASDGSDIPF